MLICVYGRLTLADLDDDTRSVHVRETRHSRTPSTDWHQR